MNTPIDLLADGEYQKYIKKFSKTDWDNLKVFYFVFGQVDSGSHNLLAYRDKFTKKSYPIAIDNSAIRGCQHVRYGELPFVKVLVQ